MDAGSLETTVSAPDSPPHEFPELKHQNVLVSGASGLVGSTLVKALQKSGAHVKRLVRAPQSESADAVCWDPQTRVAFTSLTGIDAVVHLAGDNIASGRWTKRKKRSILESRVRGTTTLCESLLALTPRPKVLVCASAVGFYGDRGDQVLTEDSASGTGFLSEVCSEWERAAEIVTAAGIRLVRLRIGVVLSPSGGALGQMLTPFKFGLGAILGSGTQWTSWIALPDLIRLILSSISDERFSGAINAVSPNPVTNAEFSRQLAAQLRRPLFLRAPAWALRMLMGEMAQELLLSSTRVSPLRATQNGFQFNFPQLDLALQHLLGDLSALAAHEMPPPR